MKYGSDPTPCSGKNGSSKCIQNVRLELQHFVSHPFAPVWDENSKVLILGTMPSPVSRANGFYYAHPRNRFWSVMEQLFQEPVGHAIVEKIAFLHRHRIALWDVFSSCEITGAADSTIKNAVANDVCALLAGCSISGIAANGRTAYTAYERCLSPLTKRHAEYFPSTSPANCRVSFETLCREYGRIKDWLQ